VSQGSIGDWGGEKSMRHQSIKIYFLYFLEQCIGGIKPHFLKPKAVNKHLFQFGYVGTIGEK